MRVEFAHLCYNASMKKTGFTLLEVLVVVLIIGILTAFVYPVLRTAVWKARVARLLPLGRYLAQQAQLFYEQNGHYPTDMELGDLVPEHFAFQHDSSEELKKEWSWYQDGELSIHCADGNDGDPRHCRWVSLSIKQEDWGSFFTLFFNACIL